METLLAIRTRRSIRSFRKRPISRKKIEKILEAGLAAPSSKNSNPWCFLAVEGSKKDQISRILTKILETKPKADTTPIDPRTGKTVEGIEDTTAASIKVIQEAAFLILIYNRSPFTGGASVVVESIKKGKVALYTYAVEILGIGAAIENILLAAHDLGLGAVFICDVYPARGEIKKMLKINHDLMGAIAVGYPAYRPPPRELRKDLIKFI